MCVVAASVHLSYPGFLYTVPFKKFTALVAQQNEEGRVEGKEGEFGERTREEGLGHVCW